MAMSTASCLKHLNPPPPPLPPQKSHSLSPTSTNNQLVPWNGTEGWWRKRCVLGVAGVAIMAVQMVGESGGLEMGNVNVNVDSRKWSEERICPQWRLNSLETIVPENLPRPTGRRRWEPAALPPHTHTAPQLRTTYIISPSSRCYSM